MLENGGALTRAFLEAIKEERDAAEFERLMLGDESTPPGGVERLRDVVDALEVNAALRSDGDSALCQLKGRRAFERLQRRHPELWQRVALTAVDAVA